MHIHDFFNKIIQFNKLSKNDKNSSINDKKLHFVPVKIMPPIYRYDISIQDYKTKPFCWHHTNLDLAISRKLFTMRFSFTVWYAAEWNLVIWNLKTIIYITIRICILCRTNAGCWVLELIPSSNWIFTEITFRLNISENTLNFKGFKVWILQVATWSKLTYTTKVVHNPMPSRPRIIFGHLIWKT